MTANTNRKYGPISDCKRTDHHTHSWTELRLIRWADEQRHRDAWLFAACHQWPIARELFEENWGVPPLIGDLDYFEEQVYDLDLARAEEWLNESLEQMMSQLMRLTKRRDLRSAAAQGELRRIEAERRNVR